VLNLLLFVGPTIFVCERAKASVEAGSVCLMKRIPAVNTGNVCVFTARAAARGPANNWTPFKLAAHKGSRGFLRDPAFADIIKP